MKVDAKIPAYPTTACADNWGMGIRTTVATKMMQSLLSKDEGVGRGKYDTEIAKRAISLAEALIEELNK